MSANDAIRRGDALEACGATADECFCNKNFSMYEICKPCLIRAIPAAPHTAAAALHPDGDVIACGGSGAVDHGTKPCGECAS